jgi:hypothetical protein
MTARKQFIKAIKNNDLTTVKELIENNKVNPSAYRYNALILAVNLGLYYIVEFILNDKTIDCSFNNDEMIKTAAQSNNAEIVELLLKYKNINHSTNNNTIIIAAHKGNQHMLRLLLDDKRINPSYLDNRAMYLANSNGDTKIVAMLWKDKRVKNTLQKDDHKLYSELIKGDITNKIVNF